MSICTQGHSDGEWGGRVNYVHTTQNLIRETAALQMFWNKTLSMCIMGLGVRKQIQETFWEKKL